MKVPTGLIVALTFSSCHGGCHGPAWLPKSRACVPLPFNTTLLSTTPAAFSDANLYKITVQRGTEEHTADSTTATASIAGPGADQISMPAVFFQLAFNVQPASAVGCSLRVGLIPPELSPAATKSVDGVSAPVWGGLEETFDIGANGTWDRVRGATFANIFPPSANLTGFGDWTLVVSTMPHTPCAYQVTANLLPAPQEASATVAVKEGGGWHVIWFDASLAAPVLPTISRMAISGASKKNKPRGQLLNCSGLIVYYAGSGDGQTDVQSNVSLARNPFSLGSTIGIPKSRHVVGISADAKDAVGCNVVVEAPKLPVATLLADGIPSHHVATPSPAPATPALLFSVPFSSAAPFSKVAVEGVGESCNVQYMFTADSFYAGSTSPVPLAASTPGLFHVQGSPTMYIPDVSADAEAEPFLLNIMLPASPCHVEFNITIFSATAVRVAGGPRGQVVGGLKAGAAVSKDGKYQPPRAKSPWFVAEYRIPVDRPSSDISTKRAPVFIIATTSETSCEGARVGFRAGTWPQGPFGAVAFDKVDKFLQKGHPLTIDLNKEKRFAPPMPGPGELLYMFVDASYGSCRFTVSVTA